MKQFLGGGWGEESTGGGITGFMFAGVPLQQKSGRWGWLQASEILDGHFTPSGKNDSVPNLSDTHVVT